MTRDLLTSKVCARVQYLRLYNMVNMERIGYLLPIGLAFFIYDFLLPDKVVTHRRCGYHEPRQSSLWDPVTYRDSSTQNIVRDWIYFVQLQGLNTDIVRGHIIIYARSFVILYSRVARKIRMGQNPPTQIL